MAIHKVKTFDLRSVDFMSGKKMAPPRDEWKVCDCCGQRIVKGAIMSNGDHVGFDCDNIIWRAVDSFLYKKSLNDFVVGWQKICGKMKPSVTRYLSANVFQAS